MDNVSSLMAAPFETPLGIMLVIGDEQAIYFVDFFHRRGFEQMLERLMQNLGRPFSCGRTPLMDQLIDQVTRYFAGELFVFKIPIYLFGTDFQQRVWKALITIPPGVVCSYAAIAEVIGRPRAHRAVAQAIGANQIAIVVPCHRVICANGDVGDYASGLERKCWLLVHEQQALAQRGGKAPGR